MKLVNQLVNETPILLQERPVIPPPRDTLRTAQVQVNGIAERLNVACSLKELIWIIGAKLDEERPVNFGMAVEV